MKRASLVAVALAGAAARCAYYNGLWSAQRLAHEAQRQEAGGLEAEARLSWGRVAVKAESVLARHPDSRWADDALVLQAEALARSGDCAAAAAPLRRALTTLSDGALRERVALAAAGCLVRQDPGADVERMLAPVLESRDRHRRSNAAYLAGVAALARGNAMVAAEWLARSSRPEAGVARLRALIEAGRPEEAMGLVDDVARHTHAESGWGVALDELSRAAGPRAAAGALDLLLRRGQLSAGARARLLIADGDRWRAARQFDRASARYERAVALVPDSVEAGRAQLRLVLVRAAALRSPEGLDSVAGQLAALAALQTGPAQQETRAWQQQIAALRGADSGAVTAFRGAELARDLLDAPELAASLFVGVATRYPASLFAPKAWIAAGQLHAVAPDSLDRVLRARYATSPYTQAYFGAPSPAFQAVEESLAVALGVTQLKDLPVTAGRRVETPRPGPRGPELDRPDTRPDGPIDPHPDRP